MSDFFCIHSGLWLCFRGNPGVSVGGCSASSVSSTVTDEDQ